jgi:hypothetical protein
VFGNFSVNFASNIIILNLKASKGACLISRNAQLLLTCFFSCLYAEKVVISNLPVTGFQEVVPTVKAVIIWHF